MNETQGALVKTEAIDPIVSSEHLFRAMANASPVLLWMSKSDSQFIFFNETWLNFTGRPLLEELGEGWLEGIHPDDRQQVYEKYTTSFQSLQPVEMEFRLKRADGVFRWVMNRGVPRNLPDGTFVGYIGSCMDISDRKLAEDEMARASELAQESSRLKSSFLANMSHEIRTPLNGIIGTTDLMLTTELSEEQSKYMKTIQDSCSGLLTVINDILDFSKIEAGKMELEVTDFSLIDVVEAQADLLAAKAHEKKLTFVTFVSPDLPTGLMGDPGRLAQILLNLCSNAIKFTDSGGVTLRATLEPRTMSLMDKKKTVWVRFSVTDTGVGLSKAVTRRLFKPFVQADGSTMRKYGGTGLGLSISKRLVELMGGEIGVDSEEGKGATFWLVVPLEESSAPLELGRAEQAGVQGLRVLLIDDDPDTREILSSYMDAWGVLHKSATHADEAIQLMEEAAIDGKPFDVAVLDYHLGDQNGLVVAQRIQDDPKISSVRLVLATAEYSKELEKRALRSGFSAYLSKPFRTSELLSSLTDANQRKGTETPRRDRVSLESLSSEALSKEGKKRRILVVDDNTVNQMVTTGQLEKLGYTVRAVSNGAEATEVVKEGVYDLILMDCQMPVKDGFIATREIRRMEAANVRRRTPIIGLTANAMKGDDQKCLEAGMDAYLSKPVKMARIAEVLKFWLSA